MPKGRHSKLDAHAADLSAWFAANVTLTDARQRLAAAGLHVSIGRLSRWWSERQRLDLEQALLDRVATGAALNRDLAIKFGKNPAPDIAVLVQLISHLVMQLSVHGAGDPKQLAIASSLMGRILDYQHLVSANRGLELDERRVLVLEARARQADAAKGALIDTTLSPEQQQARLREIFGIPA